MLEAIKTVAAVIANLIVAINDVKTELKIADAELTIARLRDNGDDVARIAAVIAALEMTLKGLQMAHEAANDANDTLELPVTPLTEKEEYEQTESTTQWPIEKIETDLVEIQPNTENHGGRKIPESVGNPFFTVGDILNGSWGCEQTNQEFYRVIKETKCFITVEPLKSVKTYGEGVGSMTGTEQPEIDETGEYVVDGLKTIRVKATDDGVKIDYAWCKIWNGKPQRFSDYA